MMTQEIKRLMSEYTPEELQELLEDISGADNYTDSDSVAVDNIIVALEYLDGTRTRNLRKL